MPTFALKYLQDEVKKLSATLFNNIFIDWLECLKRKQKGKESEKKEAIFSLNIKFI